MSRKEARDTAFKIVYQREFNVDDIETILNNTIQERNITNEEELKYIDLVVKGIKDNNTLLEDKIKENLKENWNIGRVSKLNIAILKIAIFELMFMSDDIPQKVSVNEALEFIDLYGDKKDKPFINGILAKVITDMKG